MALHIEVDNFSNHPAADVAAGSRQSAPSVHVCHASLSYQNSALFSDLSLTLPGGRWTCVLGLSGVGKTSLLRMIAGLQATGIDGHVVDGDGRSLAGRVAWMAQHDLLLPWASAVHNVLIGARLRGQKRDEARARALLARVGLTHRADARPADLSGGERQRVALARTMMEDRPIILMDEPFSALDAVTRAHLQNLAAELLRDRTVLLITHDPLEALRLGDVVLVLAGRPARFEAPILPKGLPPRPIDDPRLLHLQASLLGQLAGHRGDIDAAANAD